MRTVCLLGLTLTLTGLRAGAAEPPKEDPAQLERWVRQLGSARYREREAATTALVRQRSPQALTLLRQAASSGDLETRKRATEVLARVERAQETEKLLTPQRINLSFRDVRVTDALADFTRRTGIKVTLSGDTKAIAERKLTLETGEVSSWEAFEKLCQKAGLVEPPPRVPDAEQLEIESSIRIRRRVMWIHDSRYRGTPQQDLVLIEGQKRRPTSLNGAVRIQAVSAPSLVGPPAPVAEVALAVDVEPRFSLQRLVSIRVEEARDDLGQKLTQPEMFIGDVPQQPHQYDEMFIVWDGADQPARGSQRQADVKLRRGPKVAKKIEEVRGILSAEVETAMTPLVSVPDILKAGGQVFRGADESAVRVLEMTPDSDQYRLKVEVRLPPPTNPTPQIALWAQPGVVPVGGSVNLTGPEVEQKGLALYDAQGQPYLLATGSFQRPEKHDAPTTYTLFYQPRKDQGPPAKLVFSGKRTVVLEVPFVLRDIPLP